MFIWEYRYSRERSLYLSDARLEDGIALGRGAKGDTKCLEASCPGDSLVCEGSEVSILISRANNFSLGGVHMEAKGRTSSTEEIEDKKQVSLGAYKGAIVQIPHVELEGEIGMSFLE